MSNAMESATARHSAADAQTRITTRLPEDLHDALRTYVFWTKESANSVIIEALRTYLQTVGRERMIEASKVDTLKRFSLALDKLANS